VNDLKDININGFVKSFLDSQKSSVTGLIESYQGSSNYFFDRQENKYLSKEQGYLQNQCFTVKLQPKLTPQLQRILTPLGALSFTRFQLVCKATFLGFSFPADSCLRSLSR